MSIWYEADIRLISNCHAQGRFWTNYGMTRERWDILIHGKWGVHTLWMPNNLKMVDQIVMKFTRIAHCTQRNSHIYKHLRKNWWCQYLPFVSETPGHRWFPLTNEQLECGTWYHHPRRLQCVEQKSENFQSQRDIIDAVTISKIIIIVFEIICNVAY